MERYCDGENKACGAGEPKTRLDLYGKFRQFRYYIEYKKSIEERKKK